MKAHRKLRTRILLPALLLGVLVSQALSSVCVAQCLQHQVFVHGALRTTACHAGMAMRLSGNLQDVQTCSGALHSLCSVDLVANLPGRASVPGASVILSVGFVRAAAAVFPLPSFHAPRSRMPSLPLIIALRV